MVNTGRSVVTVARVLGVNEATLGPWVNLFKPSQDTGEAGITETEKTELLQLLKENAALKLNRALLKKNFPLLRPGILGYERQALKLTPVGKSNCRIVPKVRLLAGTRSGYYAWLGRTPFERGPASEHRAGGRLIPKRLR